MKRRNKTEKIRAVWSGDPISQYDLFCMSWIRREKERYIYTSSISHTYKKKENERGREGRKEERRLDCGILHKLVAITRPGQSLACDQELWNLVRFEFCTVGAAVKICLFQTMALFFYLFVAGPNHISLAIVGGGEGMSEIRKKKKATWASFAANWVGRLLLLFSFVFQIQFRDSSVDAIWCKVRRLRESLILEGGGRGRERERERNDTSASNTAVSFHKNLLGWLGIMKVGWLRVG